MTGRECPDCHGPIDNADAIFCPHCGVAVGISRHRPDEKAPLQPPSPKPAPSQPVPSKAPPAQTPSAETQRWVEQTFRQVERSLPRPPRVRAELPVYGQVPRPGRSLRLRTVFIVVAAALVVIAAGGVGGYLASRDGGSADTTTAMTSPSTEVTAPPASSETTEEPTTEPTTQTTLSPADGDDWPDRDGWTVIIASLPVDDPTSEAAAQERKQKLQAEGIEAGVLYSSGYSSLNPGYWAVFSGVFDTESQAAAHRKSLAGSYPEAYPRQVKR
jgi:hypothetical protein